MFINMCIFHVFTNWINHDKTSRHVAQVFSCPSASKRCVRFTPSPRSFQTETGCSQLELACWMVMTRNFHAYKVIHKSSNQHQIWSNMNQTFFFRFFGGMFGTSLPQAIKPALLKQSSSLPSDPPLETRPRHVMKAMEDKRRSRSEGINFCFSPFEPVSMMLSCGVVSM